MSTRKAADINQLWANMMVEELFRLGVTQYVLSPGSRCSPLTIAVASRPESKAVTHLDERGAAFFALGYGRAEGKPAAIICTSGTAAANYYPAVIEAAMDMVPMIVLTADRPAALRYTGANQTIDQVNLYGKYTRYFHDLPCPHQQHPPQSLLSVIDDAVSAAMDTPKGPAHINCQFDEPLAPLGPQQDFGDYLSELDNWIKGSTPYHSVQQPPKHLPSDSIESVASLVGRAGTGLLVAGPMKTKLEADAVVSLSEKLGWQVFADIRSGLRLGPAQSGNIVYFDQLLLSERFRNIPVSTVIHLGGVMTSKRYNEWVRHRKFENYVHILDHPLRHDPNNVVTERIETGVADFCLALRTKVKPQPDEHLTCWINDANEHAGKAIDELVTSGGALSEIAVARLVSRHGSSDSALFLGSSMPVRDMDMYGDPSGHSIPLTANRGASGIDGSIATAAGWCLGLARPVTAVIGDLAFLHDISSLPLLKSSPHPITLVVINNNGGGIFSFLPVHECSQVFEEYFGSPHHLSIEKITQALEIDHHHPTGLDEFVRVFVGAQQGTRSSVVEITTDREENLLLHRKLQEIITLAIDNFPQL